MPVSILDAIDISTADTWPASFAPSAGSDRIAFFATPVYSGTDANAPTGVTLGGQAMTKVEEATDATGTDVASTIWMLDESGIAAMSGSAIVVTGGSYSGQFGYTWSVQDADQTIGNTNSALVASSGGVQNTLSLTRAADSLTFAVVAHDSNASNFAESSNPELTVLGLDSFAAGAGGATDTARTADFTWTHGVTRGSAAVIINVLSATASTPTLSTVSGDDTYADGDTAIPITGAALDTATSLIVQDSGSTYQDSVGAGVVVSDPNNATFNDARANTPLSTASWQLQLRVSDGTTPDTLNVTRTPAAGWAVVEAAGTLVISGDNSVVTPYTGPDPVVTDQVLYQTTSVQGGTVTVNPNLTFNITYSGAIPASDSFDIEVWSDNGSGRVWTAVTVNVEDGVVVSGASIRNMVRSTVNSMRKSTRKVI